LQQEALDHTVWRIHFERGYGTVARLCDDTDKTLCTVIFSYVLCLVFLHQDIRWLISKPKETSPTINRNRIKI